MKRELVPAATLLVTSSSGRALAAVAAAQPTPVPAAINTGQATAVVVTSQIFSSPADPQILQGGVNLLRLNASGDATVLGIMHDDGLAGDAVAGDGIYTLSLTFNENNPGQIQLRVSVPLRGVIQRVQSDVGVISVAAFQSQPDAAPTSGTIPLTVTFYSRATYTAGGIVRWRWDYEGDGIFDVDEVGAQIHSHTYNKAGVYNAVLEVTNDKGQVAKATITITAMNPPATATATVTPSNGPAPLLVTLSGSGTSPSGTIVKYEWDRQGNGTFDFSSTTNGTTTVTFTQPGTYQPVFRVTDSLGQTATAALSTTTVRVGPPGSPTATITAPTLASRTGTAQFFVSFNGTGTPASGRTIAKYEWDFNGDGVFEYTSTTSASTSFSYTVPGTYTAAFRVTDSAGATAIDTADITVKITASFSSVSTDTYRPAGGGTVGVRTFISGTVPVTVLLKNKFGQVVRTLVNNVTRKAGSYDDRWDGKSDAGIIVPDGVYYAILQYTVGNATFTVDVTKTTGNEFFNPDRTVLSSATGTACAIGSISSNCHLNPFTNSFLRIDFTLFFAAAEVSLDIRDTNLPGLEVVQVLDRVPFGADTAYSVFWDGTDATGKAIQTPSTGSYVIGMTVYTLPDNGIFVESAPQLTGVTATPNYFDPTGLDFISPANPTTKISYTLSKAATLSLQVFRSGTNNVVRTITKPAAAGAGTIEWDGLSDTGLFADKGDYHLALKAIDGAGNQSIVRYVSIRVFY